MTSTAQNYKSNAYFVGPNPLVSAKVKAMETILT